jgi:hypothetical protein
MPWGDDFTAVLPVVDVSLSAADWPVAEATLTSAAQTASMLFPLIV